MTEVVSGIGTPGAAAPQVEVVTTPHTLRIARPCGETLAIARKTIAAIADRPVELAEAFYDHLFALAPHVRPMFPADMSVQNERLCRALLDTVRALTEADGSDDLERHLQRLGDHHARRYGVRTEHYPYIGHALVRAVRDLTGDWSASTSSAWIWIYDWMAAHMRSGAV